MSKEQSKANEVAEYRADSDTYTVIGLCIVCRTKRSHYITVPPGTPKPDVSKLAVLAFAGDVRCNCPSGGIHVPIGLVTGEQEVYYV